MPLPALRAGAGCYSGFLTVRERCAHCGLDLRAQDSGDGPAAFMILILGFVVVVMALLRRGELRAAAVGAPAVIWPLVTLGRRHRRMMRPLKATLIALQYQHRRDEFDDG